MTMREEIYKILAEHKLDIIAFNKHGESYVVDEDWFWYADTFTLNVYIPDPEQDEIRLTAYGVDFEDDFEPTDWDNVLYREVIRFTTLENL
jgi:hypothetical protein